MRHPEKISNKCIITHILLIMGNTLGGSSAETRRESREDTYRHYLVLKLMQILIHSTETVQRVASQRTCATCVPHTEHFLIPCGDFEKRETEPFECHESVRRSSMLQTCRRSRLRARDEDPPRTRTSTRRSPEICGFARGRYGLSSMQIEGILATPLRCKIYYYISLI